MKLFTACLAALVAGPMAVLAASTSSTATGTTTGTATATSTTSTSSSSPNAFDVPSGGYSATAGSTLTLTWDPTTTGTVSLYLRQGSADDLGSPTTIASDIDNSGSYTWSIPSDTVEGDDYAIEIVSADGDNYTPEFTISSTVTASSSSASTSATASTSSGSTSASASSSATGSSTTSTGTTTGSTTSTGSATASASTTKSTSTSGAGRTTAIAAGALCLVAMFAAAL